MQMSANATAVAKQTSAEWCVPTVEPKGQGRQARRSEQCAQSDFYFFEPRSQGPAAVQLSGVAKGCDQHLGNCSTAACDTRSASFDVTTSYAIQHDPNDLSTPSIHAEHSILPHSHKPLNRAEGLCGSSQPRICTHVVVLERRQRFGRRRLVGVRRHRTISMDQHGHESDQEHGW